MSGKVLLVTGHMASPGWQKISDLTLPTKEAYAEKWGCPPVVNVVGRDAWDRLLSNPDGSKRWDHTGFARTRSCQVEMERLVGSESNVEFLIYIDCDAAIVNMNFDIASHFNAIGPDASFFCSVDRNGCQSGIFGFRVCQQSLDLLEKVWNAEGRFRGDNWHEQGALAHYSTQMGCWCIPEKRLFDSYPPAWEEGDFLSGYSWAIHAPAASDEQRYEAISQALASVGYMPVP